MANKAREDLCLLVFTFVRCCDTGKIMWSCLLCNTSVSATNRSAHNQSRNHQKKSQPDDNLTKAETNFELTKPDSNVLNGLPLLTFDPCILTLEPSFGSTAGGSAVVLTLGCRLPESGVGNVKVEWGNMQYDQTSLIRLEYGKWVIITPSWPQPGPISVRITTEYEFSETKVYRYVTPGKKLLATILISFRHCCVSDEHVDTETGGSI
jgi:hypothetical protein